MTASGADLASGSPRIVTATVTDSHGNGVAGETVVFSQSGAGTVSGLTSPVTNSSGVATDTVTGVLAGSVTVTGTDGSLTDGATFPVTAGPLNHIVVAPALSTINPGSQPYTTTAYDGAGNTTDVTGSAVLSITPNGSCTTANCTAIKHGPHVVTSSYSGKTSTATLTINNVPPVAAGDSLTVLENAPGTPIAVLANDSDANLDGLTVTFLTNPSHGSATVDAGGGGVHYTPNLTYFGPDSFTYTVSDGNAATDTGTVSVTVTHVNQIPTFTSGPNVSVPEESSPTSHTIFGWATNFVPGPANESGQTLLGYTVTNDHPALFSVQPSINNSGDLTYTLAANRNATANVSVKAQDSGGTANGGMDTSVVHTFTIYVVGVDHPPAAINDFPTVIQGSGPVKIDVLANDYDPDGDPLTIVGITQGTNGRVTLAADHKSLSYDPTGSFIGSDSFKYALSDGRGGLSYGTVLVTVIRDRIGPVATVPLAWIMALPVGTTATLAITWSGSDQGFGVKYYQLMESKNNTPWQWVSVAVGAKAVHRVVAIGSLYQYRVRGVDLAGNVGAWAYLPNFSTTLYQETAATYNTAWVNARLVGALGGRVSYASTHGAVASFTCTCSSLSWIGPKSTTRGTARVYIDGILMGISSEKSTTNLGAQGIFSRTWAVLGSHRIDISVAGFGRVDVDAFLTLQ